MKLPINVDLPCEFKCQVGYYLYINTKNKTPYNCEICPENTYSNGEGKLQIKGIFK